MDRIGILLFMTVTLIVVSRIGYFIPLPRSGRRLMPKNLLLELPCEVRSYSFLFKHKLLINNSVSLYNSPYTNVLGDLMPDLSFMLFGLGSVLSNVDADFFKWKALNGFSQSDNGAKSGSSPDVVISNLDG
ncbi:uncharacterized protein LOC105177118 [Sesamum indicum]|uniref:Uncharacterized protein LOC105177118 n=1 Tax=Sesamum indicum TaxID=4182 RepID=A0A6I9UEK1_SESIN|nr:uncharacterized protein LOC105177118 [Sesamum indicum]